MARKYSRIIVIDASVVRAAGPEDASHPTSRNCRDTLQLILGVCHRVASTPAIRVEWEKHRSNFFVRWLVTMESRRKVEAFPSGAHEHIHTAIVEACESLKDRRVISKDFLLLEAAIQADNIILSLDKPALEVCKKIVESVPALEAVIWTNPDKNFDECAAWLRSGAKHFKKLTLKMA